MLSTHVHNTQICVHVGHQKILNVDGVSIQISMYFILAIAIVVSVK